MSSGDASDAKSLLAVFERLPNAVLHGRLILRDGVPVDIEILRANSECRRLAGSDSVEGSRLSSLSLPDVTPDRLATYFEAVTTGVERRVERYSERNRGWFSVHVVSLGGDEFLAEYEDVTAKRAAEQARAESEDEYRAIFDNAPVGILYADAKTGRFVNVNPTLCEKLGYRREEMLSMVRGDIAHPEDRDTIVGALLELVRGEREQVQMEARLLRKDGSVLWVRLNARRTPGDKTVAMVEDISAWREAEERARGLDSRLVLLGKLSQAAVIVSSVQTNRLLEVNDAFTRMFGWSRDEVIGKQSTEFAIYEDLLVRAQIVEDLKTLGYARAREVRLKTKTGEPRIALLSAGVAEVGGESYALSVLQDVTELRAADAALRATEARYESLFANASMGIGITDDRSGRILEANATFCAMLGYSAEELKGRRWQEITAAEHVARDEALSEALIAKDAKRYASVKAFRRKDGVSVWVKITLTRVALASTGETIRVVMIEDLTAQRTAEERSRELGEQLQAFFRASGSPILIARFADSAIVDVNDTFVETLGWSREEAIGKTPLELGFEDQPEGRARRREQLLATGACSPYEIHATTRAGERRVFLVAIALADVSGERCVLTVLHDVTALRAADRLIRESEARLRSLFDESGVGMGISDGKTMRFSHVNRALCAMLGYTPDEMLALSWRDITHPDDLGLSFGPLEELLSGKRSSYALQEKRYVRKDGGTIWVRVTVSASRDPAGRLLGLMGVVEDTSARHEADEMRKRQQATEEELRAAQKMEAVGRLAGGIAHDFNNMLSVILSYSETAMEELREDDPIRSEIAEVANAGRRAAGLTRQLLAFSRHQMLEVERIEVNALVEGFAKMLQRVIGEDIDLVIEPGRRVRPIHADRGQIEQVLMNLVVNARDAMPEGGKITLATSNAEIDAERARALGIDPGDYVEFTVSDTGSGMDDATRARIFEPFFTTKPIGKGTGLGLSTVYGIIRQSRGAIEVESAPGQGARFRIYLPSERVDATPVAASKPAAPREVRNGRERILVVEDEDALRAVVERVLKGAGYHVLVASQAEEATKIVEAQGASLDLVITDVVMPGVSGRVLAERVRALSPSTRLLFMSGYSDAADYAALVSPHVLKKPFDRATLTAKVRAVLDWVG